METEIVLTNDVRKKSRRQLAFLVAFCPLFIVGTLLLLNKFDVEDDFKVPFVACSALASILGIIVMVVLSCSKSPQEWRLVEGRLIYRSPSVLLGRSFDVLWNDVVKISPSPTEGFARCELTDSSHVEFYIAEQSGEKFYRAVKKLKVEQFVDPAA